MDILHHGGDNNASYSINGLLPISLSNTSGGVGSSYYVNGVASSGGNGRNSIIPQAGGQGAIDYGFYLGSCGGVAGNGGDVVVEGATIYAYNGDRFTTTSHTGIDSNYDASNLIIENGKTFVEAKNYAQSGVLRAVYCATTHWNSKPNNNYTYFKSLFGSDCAITGDFTKPTNHDSSYKNVCVRNEIKDKDLDESSSRVIKTNYINPTTGNCQGIGSGFGYIELSNGTYTVN